VERQKPAECTQQEGSAKCGSLRNDRTEAIVPDVNFWAKELAISAFRVVVQE
jgi:hypothetical protein